MKKLFIISALLLSSINLFSFPAIAQTYPDTTATNWQPTTTTAEINWQPTIPSVSNWHPGSNDYSDWFDVTDPKNYTGSGFTAPTGTPTIGEDDWGAINYALSKIALQGGGPGTYKALYFPPGTYLISKSLELSNTTGAALIGSGSATIIKWIGQAGGTMFISNGNNEARYLGITWNGNNIAAIGVDHRATETFETNIRYEQDIFENFTNTGVRIGYAQVLAAAEILFLNDIFQGNGTGVSFLDYNDYDNRFLKTEFINNKIGIQNNAGLIDVSETNFYGDTTADIITNVESLRFRSITSQGSGQFLVMGGTDANGEFMIHDCRISNWTNLTGGAISSAAPLTTILFDTTFSNSNPSATSPIHLSTWSPALQQMTTSNVTWTGPAATAGVPLFSTGGTIKILSIPPDPNASLPALRTSFVDYTYSTPTQVFNVNNYLTAIPLPYNTSTNPCPNNSTCAVQAVINAANGTGGGAVAYFPVSNNYTISQPINITSGKDFIILGSGWFSSFYWNGSPTASTIFNITDPVNVKIKDVQLGRPASSIGVCYVTQSSTSAFQAPSSITYDGLIEQYSASNGVPKNPAPSPFPSAVPSTAYNPCGMYLSNLYPGSSVHIISIMGPIYAANSSQSQIFVDFSLGGVIDVSGTSPKTGYFDIPFRDAGGGNYFDQVVGDNQNLTIGYDYVESSFSPLYVSGTSAEASSPNFVAGHVTIAWTRSPQGLAPFSYSFLDNGYTGNVSFLGGPYSNNTSTATLPSVSQVNPFQNNLNLLYWGDVFLQPPTFSMNSNSHFMLLQNQLIDPANDNGLIIADTLAGAAVTQAQKAMDDLRAMMNHDKSQTGYSTGL